MDVKEIARELTQRVLGLLGADVESIGVENELGRLSANATVAEAGFLIGQEGENLKALQHILAIMVSKKSGEVIRPGDFSLDINNYRKEREDYLAAVAKNSAAEAISTKHPIELPPMSAYDRRIVHLVIEGIEGVKSESVGEGEERRIVIKPENDKFQNPNDK